MTEDERIKIKRKVLDLLPEEIKSRELIKNLVKYIYDYSFNILTDAEREFIEKYPDKCLYQTGLSFRGGGFIFDNDELYREIKRPYYYSDEVKDIVLRNIDCVNIVSDEGNPCPFLGNWEIIKEKYPDLYNYCKEKLDEILSLKVIILNKISKLNEVIKLKSITLSSIKTYYPELYNIIKS